MKKRSEMFWFLGFAVLAVGIGAWGFAKAGIDYKDDGILVAVNPRHARELVDCVVASIGLVRLYHIYFPDQSNWQLVVAQVAVPGVALLSAARLFLTTLRRGVRGALASRKSEHAIVCGIGAAGMQVVQNLSSAGFQVVAVDKDKDSAHVAAYEQSGVPVIHGDAMNGKILQAAGLRRAAAVILTTGSDGTNLEVASMLESSGLLERGTEKPYLRVIAEIRNEWIHKRLNASSRTGPRISFFNPFTETARTLLTHIQIPPEPEFEAHTFVIVGFGLYGREAALQLVRAHPVRLGKRLRIVVVDSEADDLGAKFLRTAEAASSLVEFQFVKAVVDVGSEDLGGKVLPALRAAAPILGVSLAMGDDDVSLSAAMEMRSLLDHLDSLHAPVLVRLEHFGELGKMLCRIETVCGMTDRLRAFGTLEETLSPAMLLGTRRESFAEALHEDYRRRGDVNPSANHPWKDLPESWRSSNRARADQIPLMMELAGLHVRTDVASPSEFVLTEAEVEQLAALEHRRYSIEKQLAAQGTLQKQRAAPVPWEELQERDKEWNRAEIRRLPEFMAGLGMELVRVVNVRLHGEHLAGAGAAVDIAIAKTGCEWNVIVDLDNEQAVQLAYRMLQSGRKRSRVWIVSERLPGDFDRLDPEGPDRQRVKLVKLAKGWRRPQ